MDTLVVKLRLAQEGAELVGIADQAAGRIERRIADELAPNERQVLHDLLARCVDAITARD